MKFASTDLNPVRTSEMDHEVEFGEKDVAQCQVIRDCTCERRFRRYRGLWP
jgi:hypothetical protein